MITKLIKGFHLKTREFTIHTDYLELDYDRDLNKALVEDYVYEELEIPSEYIESMNVSHEYVNIKLAPTKLYFNDDWYVNLQRVG